MTDAHESGLGRSRLEWQGLVQDVDQKFEAVMGAFDALHAAMLRLKTAANADYVATEASRPVAVHGDDTAREDARRAVEQARREMAGSGAWANESASDQGEVAVQADQTPEPPEQEDSELASVAAAWLQEIGPEAEASLEEAHANGLMPPTEPAGDSQDEARREEVRLAVLRARQEMETGRVSFERQSAEVEETALPAEGAGDEAVRDEVRRAVEQARAELSSGLSMFDESAPEEVDGLHNKPAPLFDAMKGSELRGGWGNVPEPDLMLMPASIVIEDAEGRVELARVYDTLNRVERSQAALLNYSPHSVTVGLGLRDRLPDPDVMVAAVVAAFGRTCRVAIDGARMSVKMGEGEEAA